METEKKTVSVETFESGLKETSPMPLYQKKEKSSYDDFQRLGKALADSLAAGTSPLLPDGDGFVDLQPAYNVNTNQKSEGLTQIMLLEKQAELKSPSGGFVTFETLKKAQAAGVDCHVLKGSTGIIIPVVDEKEWAAVKARNFWFNLSQLDNPENLVGYCKAKMTEKYRKDLEYIKEKYPDSTYKEKKNPAELEMSTPNTKVIPLNGETEEPFQYLAQVLNAVQTGRKLYVTPEQAETFRTKALERLTAEYQPGKADVFAVKKICNSAENLYLKNRKNLQEFYRKEAQKAPEKNPRTPGYGIGR